MVRGIQSNGCNAVYDGDVKMITQDDIDAFKQDSAGQKEWVVSSVNIRDYFENLSNHDWYYEYSDDHSVYKRGSYAKSALLRTAGTHSTYKEMYKQFAKWMREERERPEIMEFLNEV